MRELERPVDDGRELRPSNVIVGVYVPIAVAPDDALAPQETDVCGSPVIGDIFRRRRCDSGGGGRGGGGGGGGGGSSGYFVSGGGSGGCGGLANVSGFVSGGGG